MNLNFFITVVFYTIILLIIHSKLKERERHSNTPNMLESYVDMNNNEEDLPYRKSNTIIPLEDVNTVDDQTNQALLKYLNLEKEESENKSHNTRLENNDLDKFFPSKPESYTFQEVPTSLANLEKFNDLDQTEPTGAQKGDVYAFEDFETQYSTL